MSIRQDSTTFYLEDSSHSDAGGDGFYDLADIYAKAGVAEVTLFKRVLGGITSWYSTLNIQWGDTAGNYTGLPTNFRLGRETIEFASGKGFKTRTTNQDLLNIYLGTKKAVGDGTREAFGKDIWGIFGSTSGTLTANWFMYGSVWQAATTTNFFNAQDNVSEIAACIFDTIGSGTVTFNFQPSGSNKFKLWYRNRVHGQTNNAGVLNSIPPAYWLEQPTVISNGSQSGINITTPDRPLLRPRIVGTPLGQDYNLRVASAGTVICEPEFSGGAPRYGADATGPLVSAPAFEAWRAYARVFNPSDGSARSGIAFELIDKRGVSQVDVTTDANGEVVFGSGLLANMLLMARLYSSGIAGPAVTDTLAPFRLRVNHKNKNYSLPEIDQQIVPSGSSTNDYRGLVLEIALGNPVALDTPAASFFREGEVDILLRRFGQDVSVGGLTVKGLYEEPTEALLEGWATHVSARDRIVTVHTGALPAAAPGIGLNTDSTDYIIRELRQVEDGALTQILVGVD